MKIVSVCVAPAKGRKMAVIVVAKPKPKSEKLFVYVIDSQTEKTLYDGVVGGMDEVGSVIAAISNGGVPPLVDVPEPPPPRGPGGNDLISKVMRNVWRGYDRSISM